MKKIVMTGGGTAGHVTPNIALMPALKEAGYDIEYIGSVNGMEKGLIEAQKIPYHGISSGKLRRYFDWKNFTDPFRVLKGYGQAVSLMKNSSLMWYFLRVASFPYLSCLPQSTAMCLPSSTSRISPRDLPIKSP